MPGDWNRDTRAQGSQPLRMVEPSHRIPPGGVTSGHSLRNVPKSCVQEIKEICMFYVQKVSGNYTDNKAAARYIHNMADEIILQLAGVATEIKKNRGEPEMYAALLEEWNEHFPPSLGQLGTPKAIASLIAQQNRDIMRLRMELEQEKLQRDEDVKGILRSMDAQLHTYRDSVLRGRRQQEVVHESRAQELRDQMLSQDAAHAKAVQKLQQSHKETLQQQRNVFEHQLKDLLRMHDDERARTLQTHAQTEKRTHTQLERLKQRFLSLSVQLADYKSKYRLLARNFRDTVALSDTEDAEDDPEEDWDTILSRAAGEDEDEDDLSASDGDAAEEEKEEVLDEAQGGGGALEALVAAKRQQRERRAQQRREQSEAREQRRLQRVALQAQTQNQALAKRSKDRKEVRRGVQDSNAPSGEGSSSNGTMARQLLSLTAQNNELSSLLKRHEAVLTARDEALRKVTHELAALVEERESLLALLARQEEGAAALRRHAQVAAADQHFCLGKVSGAIVEPSPEAHTPHFLGAPDRRAPSRRASSDHLSRTSAYMGGGF